MFVKWPSLENSYRTKEINYWLEKYPQLKDEIYVITEKLHGSNFQWYIQPNEEIKCGSRNHFIGSRSFQGAIISELRDNEKDLLNNLQNIANKQFHTFRLFGELFGDGIQKGVDYGKEKQLRYFGIMVDDKLQSFKFLISRVPHTKVVPIIEVVRGLDNALNVNSKFDSKILNKPDNICEGVVVMPYEQVYTIQSTFMLKIKNDEFKEKAKSPKQKMIDAGLKELNEEFKLYVTDNRLQNVFSKYGKIESEKQIGEYIRYLLADAREDFMKDNDVSKLDKGEQKFVFNVGRLAFNLVKEYL